jgi:hypothetical protein
LKRSSSACRLTPTPKLLPSSTVGPALRRKSETWWRWGGGGGWRGEKAPG